MKLVFAASLLSMQHQGITVKTGRPGMGIMCGSGATLSTHGLLFQCVSTIQIQLCVLGLVQSGHHRHLIEYNLFSP
jgi:hypothetical protein